MLPCVAYTLMPEAPAAYFWSAVDAAVRSVRAALAALVPKSAEIDRTVLEQILSAAEALDLSDYTAESRAALQTALETARAVLSGADQAAIDAAAQALLDAMAGLAPDAALPVIDRAALEKALSEAEAIVKELYPAESVAALEAVIEAAKAILSDETAAQACRRRLPSPSASRTCKTRRPIITTPSTGPMRPGRKSPTA